MSILGITPQDEIRIDGTVEMTRDNSEYYTEISDQLVSASSADLDSLMARIRQDCVDSEPSDAVLEQYTLELSNLLYFIGQRLETMGIKEDLTKMAAKEAYNTSYMKYSDVGNGKKPTVAELTALSEDDSKYQSVINSIYSRVYRQLKYKVDAAYEMLSSIRKIISKRMQDSQLSMTRQSGGIVVGKEEF